MKKIEKVKLFLDEKTKKFTKTEIPGAPFIEAHQEIEVPTDLVAYFDVSGSQSKENLTHYVEKAREMGIKKYALFSGEVLTDILNMDAFSVTPSCVNRFDGITRIAWIESLPENIKPVVFTDGDFYDARDYTTRILCSRGVMIYYYSHIYNKR